jgi:ArsR family transcriptional regulator
VREASKVFKALSDDTRLRILKMLEVRPLSVSEIQYAIKGSQPNVSHHLKTLVDAGLVENRRDGLWIVYRIANPNEDPLKAATLALLRRSLKKDASVLDDRTAIKGIDRISVSVSLKK